MKCAVKKLRSPLKWHGGKSYLARRIVALFPEHRVYVEPYIGGGSILLNKAPSEVEIAGDVDWNLMSFWRDLQRRPDILIQAWRELEYSQAVFDQNDYSKPGDWEPSSTRFLVRNRMSRGGLGKDFAWSERLRGKKREGGPIPGDENAWLTILEEMDAIADRIKGVRFDLRPAIDTIREHDCSDAVIYCDPPYLHETRTAKKAYAHEMTVEAHQELLSVLKACQGKVFLSGYRSALYDGSLADWKRTDIDMPNHSGQGATKERRIECVWENPTALSPTEAAPDA